MSPAGPESASNENKIQREQLRIDTFDRKNDGKVEGTDTASPEQVAERTKAYINRVNDVQGRVRSLRLKVEIGKDMRNPNWPALEKACNDVEGGLAEKLVAVSVENLQSGIPEFSASIDRFLQSLQTEEIRDVRRYAAGPTDAAAVRRRSDEAYNVRLVEARKTGGIPHVDAIDEVIRSNEAELAYLRGGVQPAGWRFDLWGTVQQRREALEGALPVYRAERRKVLESLPKDQPTIQRLCDRSDAAWVAMNTARFNLRTNKTTDVPAVVMTYETLIDVNEEELSFLESHPNPSTVNDKTGETLTSRMVRIREMLPSYRTEYLQLRGEQAEPGADSPKTTAEQIINKLAEGTGIEPKLLVQYARTAKEVYGEDTMRTVVSRVALVNKLNPAICEAAGFPFKSPVDAKQLTIQLGTGVLPVRPTPQQAETVTHAYLLGRPEDVVRRKYEFVLDRVTGPQKKIAEYQTFIENETKNLANETRNDADEQVVKQLARNIESARAAIRTEQETVTGYQQILFNLEAAITVFDATIALNDGRQQESDRIYLKLREKYGPDLAKMDADLGKRVTEAIEGLKKRNQLTPFELALVEGRDQDAVKLAVDRQQSNRDSDLLAQMRSVPPRSVDVRMLRRGGIPDEDGSPMPGGRVLTLPRGGRRNSGIDLGADFENTTEKFRKQGREFLLAQNGQNGCTVTETGTTDFFKMYNVKTATLDGTFTCGFDGEWSFSEYKPGQRSGYLNPNWFTDAAIPEAERNALNAIHRGLLERSDPEVRRRREDRERGPELGSYESNRTPDIFGPRNDIVNSSFSIQPFDSYMGRYEGEQVPVDITTSNVAGFRGTSLFKLSVSGADHLVAFDSGFVSKLSGAPPGYTAVLRRAPSRPTFGNVYRVPSNRLGERARYAQQVTSFDTLKKEDLCFVRIGRSPEEMREVERRGLEILAAHNPEIVTQRRWERSPDDIFSLDTTVRVKKGTLVVEYTFSSTDGVWLCREVERDGKNFLDFRDPVLASNAGRFHGIDVRYSPSDDARKGFNGIGEALSKLEGGMTGRSALQIVGEPRPQDNDPLASAAFVNARNPRSASIPDVEKRSVEDSRDVLRAMDNDPAVRGVLTQAGTISSSITLIQRLFDAGKNGTRRQGLVDLMRREAGTVLGVLNDPALKTNLLRSRVRLEELKRANTGVDKSAIDREIDQRIKALDDMEAMLSKPQLRDFCEHIRDKSEYNVSTFWTWLEENIAVIVAIVVACLAVVLAVFTFGITSPLAVAAISASAGVIASELTSEARFQLHQEFDEEVTSGRATFRNRSRTGAFTRAVIKDEKIYNPETGTMEHADVLTHLINPLGQDFVTGFVTTLAFMGAGAAIGRGLTVLANTQCVQGLIANSPRLTRIIAYFAKAEQGAPLAQKNMKNFLSNWGRETAEEFRDEVAERIAGDWASAVFIAKKNFKPKNPSDPKTLARSDASVRNMGEFEYETNGNPVQAIAEITASMTAEGGKVTVAADGKITVEIDGRVFLLSPDVAVTPSGPEPSPAPAPGPAVATETAPGVRAQAVKLAEAARADARNIAELKSFLKANDVDDATRLEIAEKLLGRPLGDTERKAIIASHNAPGSIDNLTAAEIFGKARPLLEVMSRTDAQLLLDAAVCGKTEPFDARRIRPGQSCTVQTSSGRLLTASFLRVQGGKYIFSYAVGSGSLEVTVELQNIIGLAETVPRAAAGVSDQTLLTHVQSGEPIRIEDGGATREFVYVRMSTTDSNIIIMRDRATGVERRFPKSKVFSTLRGDDPGEVIPLTPAPAPAAVITDAQVERELGFGLKIKINGREYDVISRNPDGDYMLEDVKLGTVKPFKADIVLQAGRVAMQFERANAGPAPISDAAATGRILAGLEVELEGERFTYSRPSAQPGNLAMKRADGTERRFPIASVIAAAKVVMAAEARLAPAPAPAAEVPLTAADLRVGQTYQITRSSGAVEQWTFVGIVGGNPQFKGVEGGRTIQRDFNIANVSRLPAVAPGPAPAAEAPLSREGLKVGQTYQITRSSGAVEQWTYLGTDVEGNPGFKGIEAGRTVERGFPMSRIARLPVAPAPAAEAPLTRADFKLGEVYLVTRSSGEVQQWRYVGVDVDGNPSFEPMVGNEGASNFPIGRIRRLPLAAEIVPVAPKIRLAPGSIEVGGVEVAKGRPLITRPFANGPSQVLTFDSVDPQNADLAIVTDAQGNKYRISLTEVRTWTENTGVKPGEQVTALPTGTEVQDKKSGKTFIVVRVNPDGTVMCSQQSNSGRIYAEMIPYKQLRVVSFSVDENVVPAPIGPSVRRVLAAGDPVVVLSGGRLQEGWAIRRNPRTNQLEAYNSVTRATAPIDPNTVFHPGDFSENVPALEGKPETVFLRRKFEYLNTPGRLPLSNRSFQRLFPPDGDFSQQNVGNCYLLAALHSLRQSPHFEVLVRSAITPITEELDVPDPANRGRTKKERFTVGFDVRIPLGDPNGKIVRVNYDDLEGGQQTVNNLYLAVEGPVGFQILEAAYTLALHGRDRDGQINRKASSGGQSEEALLELIGQQAGLVSRIGGSDDVLLSDQGSRTTQQVKEFFDNYSPDKYLATASSLPGDTDTRTYTARDAAGNRVNIHRKHAYSIESIDRNAKTVTVVNPHDTSAPMVFTYDGFMKAFRVVKIVEINHRQILK